MDIFRYFEDVKPSEKLLEIIKNADEEVVASSFETFFEEIATLELTDEGRETDFSAVNERADQIMLRLMSSIVSRNG